ncbi:MAG TPA: hypothetical protein PLR74_15725 [Agriterribacter sp.]|nr:hypothetical protein [Agriterribacter sp.]
MKTIYCVCGLGSDERIFIKLNWKNEWLPEKLYHLHGTPDRIFPYPLVHPTHTIASAGHFLVFRHAKEVSAI